MNFVNVSFSPLLDLVIVIVSHLVQNGNQKIIVEILLLIL